MVDKREILFRGNSERYGEWIYGDLRHISDRKGGYNLHIVDNTNGRNNDVTGLEIIPETVGQYTGLTDKNGRKIFEGDIVIFNRKRNLPNYESIPEVIKYNQGDCAFQRYPYGQSITKGGAGKLIKQDMMAECEVIGNIHDNPELLEGGGDNA